MLVEKCSVMQAPNKLEYAQMGRVTPKARQQESMRMHLVFCYHTMERTQPYTLQTIMILADKTKYKMSSVP